MKYKITLIPGDGIGPEVVYSAKRCIEATGIQIDWDFQEAGESSFRKYKQPISQDVIN